MCGIAGFCNLHKDSCGREHTIRRMTEHLRERGPDAEGVAFYSVADGVVDVTFGHRRLAIIDLSEAGEQPMDSHSGRLSIVYNGEIYNHRELRTELENGGFVRPSDWRGTSDTEILLEAVEAFGLADALRKCRGMFAVAILDHRTGRLSLARDRVGEKPLYYGFAHREGAPPAFVFASDIGCFTEIDGFRNEIDRAVLPLYFVHGYIPAPYTIYQDIWKLEPGTILTVEAPYAYFNPQAELDAIEQLKLSRKGRNDGQAWSGSGIDGKSGSQQDCGGTSGIRLDADRAAAARSGESADASSGHAYETYWSMWEAMEYGQRHPFRGTFGEASAELERLLIGAIRGQMIADVPVGAFLSAGIDSPTIVALMQQVAREDGKKPVRTFTIGMREAGFNEAEIAQEIAAHLGTDHTEKYITKEDALAVIPRLARMFGEPFADSSQIPTFLVSAMTREHVTVSLSGDAGDELFCGYTSFYSIKRIWDKIEKSKLPWGLRRAASKALIKLPQIRNNEIRCTKARLFSAKTPVDLHRLESYHEPIIGRIALPAGEKELPHKLTQITDEGFWRMEEDRDAWGAPFREVMLADLIFYHPDDILVKVDRCAMANSLETRVPLLDPAVVEFAWTLPTEYLTDVVRDESGRPVPDSRGNKTWISKRILRDILYRHVPRELMDRPKKGFSIPIEQWLLEEPLRSWAEDLLAPERIRRENLLDAEVVRQLWTDYTERGIWRVQVWYVLMFEAWIRNNT